MLVERTLSRLEHKMRAPPQWMRSERVEIRGGWRGDTQIASFSVLRYRVQVTHVEGIKPQKKIREMFKQRRSPWRAMFV